MRKQLAKRIGRRAFLKIISAGTLGFGFGRGISFRTSAAPKEILIGDIHPTSGGSAEFGKACQEGTP